MKENQYKCAMCGNVYDNEWTDEEARAEAEELFMNKQLIKIFKAILKQPNILEMPPKGKKKVRKMVEEAKKTIIK